MVTETFRIEGMTCGHCVMSVRKSIAALEGVEVENVEVGSATVSYDNTAMTRERILRAIDNAGYSVRSAEPGKSR